MGVEGLLILPSFNLSGVFMNCLHWMMQLVVDQASDGSL